MKAVDTGCDWCWSAYQTYRHLPTWGRVAFAVLLLGSGLLVCWTGHARHLQAAEEARRKPESNPLADRSHQAAFRGGLVLTLIGCGVLITSGRTNAEKNGYRF